MRVSQLLNPTLREVPAEAEVVSQQLLLRAGFIRKTASGVYTYLPLAQRVLKKIQQIVREEMDRQGGQELLMPIIQPAELWLESGRWHVYGPELFRLKDRHGRDFCLGPTHEEVITSLVRGEVRSYKQLPLLLYHIGNKYRDERRPRFGLMRGREFIMKDLYSFDIDQAGLEESYRKMHEAYTRVFTRCGLKFRPVEADSGAIGGSTTHEFMVLADSGEATILYCGACDYVANIEKAALPAAGLDARTEAQAIETVATPGIKTITQLEDYLHIDQQKMIKALVYQTDKEVVVALLRGDRELNEIKLLNNLGAMRVEMADAATIERITAAPPGFTGPVGLTGIRLVADEEVMQMQNAVAGANQVDTHYLNVNPGRDFKPDLVADIRLVQAGESCPQCGAPLLEAKGIEVGQIFQLGTKYSKVLGATFLDAAGREKPIVMGCYGIGISRTMAAAIEQNYDQDGIIWPAAIAPYQVMVIPVAAKDQAQMAMAEQIYQDLNNAGVETILDDRTERPGVKFKDADLVGYPLRIVVGKNAVSDGALEVRIRRTGITEVISINEIVSRAKGILETL